jgi:hypothetical protein
MSDENPFELPYDKYPFKIPDSVFIEHLLKLLDALYDHARSDLEDRLKVDENARLALLETERLLEMYGFR